MVVLLRLGRPVTAHGGRIVPVVGRVVRMVVPPVVAGTMLLLVVVPRRSVVGITQVRIARRRNTHFGDLSCRLRRLRVVAAAAAAAPVRFV